MVLNVLATLFSQVNPSILHWLLFVIPCLVKNPLFTYYQLDPYPIALIPNSYLRANRYARTYKLLNEDG